MKEEEKKKFKVALIANDGHPIPEWVGKKFKEANIDFVFHDCHSRKELEEFAKDADVLFLTSSRKDLITEENMDIFEKAGCVIKCGSGTDNIENDACNSRGIIIAHTPEDPTEPTSNHFIAMLFTAVRQTARQDRLIRSGIWDAKAAMPIGHLTGADLGVVGFGRIGKSIVKKLSGFEMTVRVFDPFIKEDAVKAKGCTKVELKELLEKSQYVMISCPLLKETEDLIGENELKMMRRDAILVNVARAGIVNEDALKKALRNKWIKAAALDVIKDHPLKPGSEWLEFENINFTPHLGGYTEDYPDQVFKTPVDVIIEISKGNMPTWIVNRECKPKWNLKS